MKILFTVEFYEPQKGGAEEVVRQLSQRFAANGHHVTVATTFTRKRKQGPLSGISIEQFKLHGNAVKGIRGHWREKRRYQLLLQEPFDIVVNYAAQNWPTDLAFEILDKISACRVLVPCGYSGLLNPKYAGYFQQLPALLKKYDTLTYMSSHYQDKLFGDAQGVGDKALLIPNGASAEEFLATPAIDFRKKYELGDKKIILTVANHYFAKGHTFILNAFSKMKTKNTELVIIGELPSYHSWFTCYPFCLAQSIVWPRITILKNLPRAEVVAAYRAADVFLFGSEIECAPLVMYESFAAHLPFLTRPVGNVADHKDILTIVRTPSEMAVRTDEILTKTKEANVLAKDAFKLWQAGYRWDQIAARYEQLFIGLLARKR